MVSTTSIEVESSSRLLLIPFPAADQRAHALRRVGMPLPEAKLMLLNCAHPSAGARGLIYPATGAGPPGER